MSDLINGFISVKDPLSLFAFLALILLVAFRTKQVPERFFKLLNKTIDGPTLERLTRRFMAYTFAAFVVVCGCAVTGQVLAHATGTRPYSTEAAKQEIGSSSASDTQKDAALRAYSEALALERSHRIDDAIQSLQASIAQVPSLSAEYTLALLYQRKRDDANAGKHIAQAAKLVKPGDTMAQVRVQRLADAVSVDNDPTPKQDCQFIGGHKTPLDTGGADLEHATKISTGLYTLSSDVKANQYYKLKITANQTLKVTFRTPDFSSDAWAAIHNADGAITRNGYAGGASAMAAMEWKPDADGWVYLSVRQGTRNSTLFCVALK